MRTWLTALGLLLLLVVSLSLKAVKYGHDRRHWQSEQDAALLALFTRAGFTVTPLLLTHGGLTSAFRAEKPGCPGYELLNLHNSEDGVLAAFRRRAANAGAGGRPVTVVGGEADIDIPYVRLYLGIAQDELRRQLGLTRRPAGYMIHPDPRAARPGCAPAAD